MNYVQVSVELHLMKMNLKAAKVALDTLTLQVARLEQQLADDTKPVLALVPVSPVKTEPAPEPPVQVQVKAEPVKVEVVQEVKEDIVITPEWSRVLDVLNYGTEHVFLTGGAGTGKSTLLHYFVERCSKNVAVIAPTGVAAIRAGGQTLHSFFHFKAQAYENDDVQRITENRWRQKYEKLDILVIDEVSMIRADLMDAVEKHLRMNGPKPGRPFGGVRLVLIGDLFQLPPVVKEKGERKYLQSRYGTESPFFFHSECFRDNPLRTFELTTIFRQKDPAFTSALNSIRQGVITPEHLELINSRVNPGFVPPKSDELWLTLTTTNDSARIANERMLASLKGPSRWFEATRTGLFDLKDAPTANSLELKPGAVVMFVKNDQNGNWVNGTMGRVMNLDPLTVAIHGIEHKVEPQTWDRLAYEWDEDEKKLTRTNIGSFTQIPLKPAAALTIHKVQGLSLDRAFIDLGHGTFAAGQGYVSLSRLRDLKGLFLRRPLRESDLITDTEVIKFMKGEPIAKPAPRGQLSLLEPISERT